MPVILIFSVKLCSFSELSSPNTSISVTLVSYTVLSSLADATNVIPCEIITATDNIIEMIFFIFISPYSIAAPIIPASLKSFAATISVFFIYLLNPLFCTYSLTGFNKYSLSLLIPPPIAITSG